MRTAIDLTFESALMSDSVPDAGFYSWDIPENILYADNALAELFGLDQTLAETGLPIDIYLERVHAEDRPRLAKTIRDSIVGHHPQQEAYRVMSASGSYVAVASYGRVFAARNILQTLNDLPAERSGSCVAYDGKDNAW